jgi:plasmid stabilization system protein ParE
MSVRKADDFIAAVARQFDWYLVKAGWEVADRYLDAVEATCRLLGQHPNLGPRGGFTHPRLHEWRCLLVSPPFNQHILFYELGRWQHRHAPDDARAAGPAPKIARSSRGGVSLSRMADAGAGVCCPPHLPLPRALLS